jgi:hypothetical protein
MFWLRWLALSIAAESFIPLVSQQRDLWKVLPKDLAGDWPCRDRLTQGAALGFNEQMFGADEQVPGRGQSD